MISLKLNLFSPLYSWKKCVVGVKQQSFTPSYYMYIDYQDRMTIISSSFILSSYIRVFLLRWKKTITEYIDSRVMVMVFNATLNNSSAISWRRSDLLVEETGASNENHRLAASHWPTLSRNVVSSTPRHELEF
jgi:hypothetical protein